MLGKTVGKLVDKLGIDVELGWDAANYLHIWGFHEARLNAKDVKRRGPVIKRLIEADGKIKSSAR